MTTEFDFVSSPIAEGLSVIEASAGTGKTYAISHLVPRLLLDGTAANVGEILLVTFTKDAAAELSDRVRRVLERLVAAPQAGEATQDPGVHFLRKHFGGETIRSVIGRALLDLDRLNVSTIHSFCLQTLQTEGTLCGLPVIPELVPDASAIVEETMRDLWETEVASSPLMTSLALAGNWSLWEDLSFVTNALAIPGVEFVPAPRPFSEIVEELRSYPARFDAECCSELRKLLDRCEAWNKTAPEGEAREELLRMASDASEVEVPGFIAVVGALAVSGKWITARSKANKELKAAIESCNAVRIARDFNRLIKEAGWYFRIHCLDRVRRLVGESLRAKRQITYDGLVETLQTALTRGRNSRALAAALRERYAVALIDESQDTDPRQFAIFERIFLDSQKPKPLVLIGDPKQAIYAFRGADVNTYLHARNRADGKLYSLTKTFRAPQSLVQAVNAFFARPQSILKEGLTFHPAHSGLSGEVELKVPGQTGGPRAEVWLAPDGNGEYATSPLRLKQISGVVASEIVRLLNAPATLVDGDTKRLFRPGDCAVLVSAHFEAQAVAEALRARGVAAVRAGGDDVMASAEAAELLIVLRGVFEPRRSGLLFAALGTRLLGRDAFMLRSLRDESSETVLELFARWQAIWNRDGVATLLARMDSDEGIAARLATQVDGERRITNFRQLTDLLQAASRETGNDPARLLRWFGGEIGRAERRVSVVERQLQLESDADAVQIVTMHAAKGLEYPLVFCPFLFNGGRMNGLQKLAEPGRATRLVDTGLIADEDEKSRLVNALARANMEDRLRLAYVAMTRARVRLWVFGGETSGPRSSPAASALDWLLREKAEENFDTWRLEAGFPGRESRHRAGLEALAKAAEISGEVAWGPPPEVSDDPWLPAEAVEIADLEPLSLPEVPAPWSMTSFSALTREKSPYAGIDEPSAKISAAPPANAFATAPAGTAIGTAIHDWIEQWDFSAVDRQGLERHLARYPLRAVDGPSLTERVVEMLGELRSAELPGMDCSLGEACPLAGASEWIFQLPINRGLDPVSLAAVFAAHGQPAYAAVLANLAGEQLQGYLHGFIDRLACHSGQWGVIDWKTNNLGASADAYSPAALENCAMHSHYLLQAYLYLVALRRFLGTNVPIRGAWIVFLRGVSAGTDKGILHIQPEPALMAALDALFAKPEGME